MLFQKLTGAVNIAAEENEPSHLVVLDIGGGVLGLICFLWYKTPAQGRTAGTFTVFAVLTHLLYSVIHFFFWTMPSGSAVRQLAVQQLTAVPVIAVFSWLFWKVYSDHG